jgi:hypothetical protein
MNEMVENTNTIKLDLKVISFLGNLKNLLCFLNIWSKGAFAMKEIFYLIISCLNLNMKD